MSDDAKGRKAPKTVIEQSAAPSDAERAPHAAGKGAGTVPAASGSARQRARKEGAADNRKIPGTVRVVRDVLGDTDETFERYAGSHKNTVLCGFIGLVAALLVLFLGFWDALVIALFVLIGVIIGQALDGDNGIVNFFRRHFGGR